MILEMTRVQILGIRGDLQQVVHKLHQIGTLQIDDIHNIPDAPIHEFSVSTETQKSQEDSRYLITQLQGLIQTLSCEVENMPAKSTGFVSPREIRSQINSLTPRVQELNLARRELLSEQEILPRYITTLKKLLPMVPSSANQPGNATIGVLIDVSHINTLDWISKRVLEITRGKAEFVAASVDESTQAMMIVCPRAYASEIENLLGQKDVSQLHLPTEFSHLAPQRSLDALNERLEVIPVEIQEIDDQLGTLGEEWCPRLNNWLLMQEDTLDEVEVLSHFGETEHTFIIYGWVPTRDYEALKQALEEEIGSRIFVSALEMTPETRKLAPVAMENPGPVRPFERLVRLRAVPLYEDIDPSGLTAFFLPLFFGMMLGDIGYGLVLLVGCLVVGRRMKSGFVSDLLKILRVGAIWAIVFGFLYGEAFGALGERFGLHAIWMDRASPKNLMGFILTFVGVGAIHITLGLVLGVWQAAVHRNRNHLLERGGMLVGLIGLFLLTATLAELLPASLTSPSIAAIIVGVVLLGASMGKAGAVVAPIEFIGVIGNILSYMRIAAIGLASVYLAKVANDLGGMIGNLVMGALVAVLIHALNLVMGAFSPTIHSMRLHYVEFYRKFYEGGGRPYVPFRSHSTPDVGSSID